MHPTLLALVTTLCVLTAPAVAQAAKPAPQPFVVTTHDGSWDFASGTTVDIAGKFVHGADRWTNATIYWPQTATREASRFVVDVAADSFGNRQPWLVAFAPASPILWVVRGAFGKQNDGKPVVDYIRRVDLADPADIVNRSVVGAGPNGFLPKELQAAIRKHMFLPATNQRAVHERRDRATRDHACEVLCRVRVLDRSGAPRAGIPLRFPVVLLPQDTRLTPKAPAPQALHAPSNNGLDIVRAVTDADGYATALVPISSRGRDRGASIHPALTNHRGATAPPIAKRELQRIAPVTIDKRSLGVPFRLPTKSEPPVDLIARIVDADGQPVAGHTVALAPVDRDGETKLPPALVPALVRTDANGRFVLRDPRATERLRPTVRVGKHCATLRGALEPTIRGTEAQPVELVLQQDQKTKTWSLQRRVR